MNSAFDVPSAGTAPHDEIGSQHSRDTVQRDDREATMPEEDFRPRNDGLPEGFRYGKTAAGKPTVLPTQDSINELFELATEIFDDRDQRDQELAPDTKLTKHLDGLQRQLATANDFLASGLSYQLVRAYQAEFAGAVNWVRIHATNMTRHTDAGNEMAAENSLQNLEASRLQAFKTAQILDWCVEQGADVNIMKGCQDALGLAGWRLMNQDRSQDRKAAQRTTRDLLWSRGAKQPDQVAEEAEGPEDELDF